MKILETQYNKRVYDGKIEKIAKIVDEENKYSYKTESGSIVSLVPTKWITVDVLDNMPEKANA